MPSLWAEESASICFVASPCIALRCFTSASKSSARADDSIPDFVRAEETIREAASFALAPASTALNKSGPYRKFCKLLTLENNCRQVFRVLLSAIFPVGRSNMPGNKVSPTSGKRDIPLTSRASPDNQYDASSLWPNHISCTAVRQLSPAKCAKPRSRIKDFAQAFKLGYHLENGSSSRRRIEGD